MLLTVRDAARLLHSSEREVYGWIAAGEIPCHRVDDQYRFNRSELLEWATSHGVRVAAEIFHEPGAGEGGASGGTVSLADGLARGGVHHDVPGDDRAAVLRAVVERLPLPDGGADRDFLLDMLLAREAQGSTGVGDGIALPHVRNPVVLDVDAPTVTLCFIRRPIDFAAVDGKPVHTLFTIVSPSTRSHLLVLSRLGAALHDAGFKAALAARAPAARLIEEARKVELGWARAPGASGGPPGGTREA